MKSRIYRLRKAINGLRASGLTWQEVADHFGGDRAQAYMIAKGKWIPKNKTIDAIIGKMPILLFWEGPKELDKVVLWFLRRHGRLTGAELARRSGTTDRTIRTSIKRLREAGYHIEASMVPPRGYSLRKKNGN